MQHVRTGKIEERLVQRQRFNLRREVEHHGAMDLAAAVYLPKFGRMTMALGQSSSALNIGMAERTPSMRAT